MRFEANQRVRVRTAPDKEGRITGRTRERAGRVRYQVDFGASLEYVLETNLEPIAERYDVYDLLESSHYGSLINLRTAITHRRLSGRLADVVYSMEATNTEFYPYQFKPVLNFLDSPSRGLLIADEVGLGKTIEAGLIWTELRARVDAERLLVLCPAVLREKWKEELAHRFGVRADISTAGELAGVLRQYRSGTTRSFAVIGSLQGMRPPRGWEEQGTAGGGSAELARLLQQEEAEDPLFDCVIIDEAHYLRNPWTQTHLLARLLRPVAESMILLSATPIQLRSEDLFQVLNLIDEESFQYVEAFREVLEANQPLMELAGALRRSVVGQDDFVDGIQKCLGHRMLRDNRQLEYMLRNPPGPETLEDPAGREAYATRVERVNLLARVVNRTRKRDVQENRVIREPQAPHVPMGGIEQEFYSRVTESVRDYCLDRDLVEGFILTIPQRQMCSSMPAAFRAWNARADQLVEEEFLFEATGENDVDGKQIKLGPLVQRLAGEVASFASFETLRASDSKYTVLLETLEHYRLSYPDKKVIVFSYYRGTLRYLAERLAEDGFSAIILMGGMRESKHGLIERFRRSSSLRILLASEVASEGVDLQFCSFLINYDLPWNPMRVEQRIGRIDRIGQKEPKINVVNLFYGGSLDEKIYQRLYERLDVFRYALGDLEAVLGEEIRQLTHELLTHRLTAEQEERRIEQTQLAVARQRREQEELEQEAAQLAAHGDYVLNKVRAARELRRFIDGEHLWMYVRDFLQERFPGTRLVRKSDEPLEVEIELAQDAKVELRHFLDTTRLPAGTRLAREQAGRPVRCLFSNQADFADARYEVVSQQHPLVRFITAQLAGKQFFPLVAGKVSSLDLGGWKQGVYLVTVQQWSTSGARTIEKLVYRGARLRDGAGLSDEQAERLVSAAVSAGDDWRGVKGQVDAEAVLDLYERLVEELDDKFSEYAALTEMENNDQVDYLIRILDERKRTQIGRIREVMERQKERGETRLLKANEGRIRKLQETLEIRKAAFEKQRAISTDSQHVCTGLIHVT